MVAYSRTWYELFGSRDDPEQTGREVSFLARQLPLPEYRRVLDVCCGYGRHVAGLTAAGYDVVGIERDREAAEAARRRAPGAEVLVQDALALRVERPADAAIVMWATFGLFPGDGDRRLLRRVRDALRPRGRLVLDVYHPPFFRSRAGTVSREVAGREVVETRALAGGRLVVELDYGAGVEDRFEWRLYEVDELEALAAGEGFALVGAGAGFDERAAPGNDVPRVQVVLERE